jgi:hypothetical protein
MAHFEPSDPAEDKLRKLFESLLVIRRQYAEASSNKAEANRAGKKVFSALTRELRVKPKRAKASKE